MCLSILNNILNELKFKNHLKAINIVFLLGIESTWIGCQSGIHRQTYTLGTRL